LAALVEPLLIVRRVVREQLGLHRRLLSIVRDDDVCRRLVTIPGVGPVVALTYRVTVDVPARFRNSKAVGAVFGLTPAKYKSGETDRTGAISRCGDEMMRMMLYEAAQIMLVRSVKWSWLKAWGDRTSSTLSQREQRLPASSGAGMHAIGGSRRHADSPIRATHALVVARLVVGILSRKAGSPYKM
jgi:Transposase IS116/IS110/IS902 family